MKVAILISGQPRNFEKGYEQLKAAYLDKYDCDVFLHTWDSDTHSATQFFPDRPANVYNLNVEWKEKLIALYNPTRSKFENPIIFDKHNIVDSIWRQPLQNSKSMWYSVQSVFDLTNSGYDVYIRTRYDLRYEASTIDLEKLDLNTLHIWDWNTDHRVKHRGYYDVFAVGNYDTIGIYASLYPKMDWYLNHDDDYTQFLQGGWPGQDSKLRNEYLLKWHLLQSGVPVQVHNNVIPHADGHIIR